MVWQYWHVTTMYQVSASGSLLIAKHFQLRIDDIWSQAQTQFARRLSCGQNSNGLLSWSACAMSLKAGSVRWRTKNHFALDDEESEWMS